MSSSLLLRSAINAAKRCSSSNILYSTNNASLSTISVSPSWGHYDNSSMVAPTGVQTLTAPSPVNSWSTTPYNAITSYLSNMMGGNLSGDSVLTTVDNTMTQIEKKEDGEWEDITATTLVMEETASALEELSIWQISTLKRRKKMMNKHKLRKRRKKLRLKTRRG